MNADSADHGRIDDDQVGLIVEVFRMLADPTRVQVLWALVGRELSGQRTRRIRRQACTVRLAAPGQAADGPAGQHPQGGHDDLLQHRERHVGQLVSDAVFNAEHAGPGVPAHHRGDVASLPARKASR
jgi:DNA-binding transcriptional ArsR family regulator